MNFKIWHLILFLSYLAAVFISSSLVGPRSADCQETESSYQKMAVDLKKKVAELQDGNALLMENLMNCVDENDELKQKLEKSSKTNSIEGSEDKRLIIESIRKLLETDVDLSFLMKIEENNLKTLFEIIKKGIETGKTGK